MSKQYMEDHERDAMVDSIRCRREDVAPELPENPPPDAKWKAKQGLNQLNLNGAEHDVMGCLIDRASSKSGLCYPSEEFIQGWTGRPMRTIQRAIRTLWDKRLINITRRSLTSNRYFIQWEPLFAAYRAQKAFERGVTLASRRRHAQKVADHDTKSGGSHPPEVAAKPSNRTYEENLRHEMAHQPSAADAKEAFRKEHSEEDRVTLTAKGLTAGERLSKRYGLIFWTDALVGAEKELKRCTLPEQQKKLEEKIADCINRIEELRYEQRDETAAGTS